MSGELTDTDRLDAIAAGLCVRQESIYDLNSGWQDKWFAIFGNVTDAWSMADTMRDAMDAAILVRRQGIN